MNTFTKISPVQYEAWYQTPRGQWISGHEWRLLNRLLPLPRGATVLDVGSGTGHFSRRMANAGLKVIGVEPDAAMREFAQTSWAEINYQDGDALNLQFDDASFDYVSAITSLCFIHPPQQALKEMWRVCRKGVLLGLLHRHSLLHLLKRGRRSYAGARWDTLREVRQWLSGLDPLPVRVSAGTAILLPTAGPIARMVEHTLAEKLKLGGFLAVTIEK